MGDEKGTEVFVACPECKGEGRNAYQEDGHDFGGWGGPSYNYRYEDCSGCATSGRITIRTFWQRECGIYAGYVDYSPYGGIALGAIALFCLSPIFLFLAFRLRVNLFHSEFPMPDYIFVSAIAVTCLTVLGLLIALIGSERSTNKQSKDRAAEFKLRHPEPANYSEFAKFYRDVKPYSRAEDVPILWTEKSDSAA
jgi:hypothetical protein